MHQGRTLVGADYGDEVAQKLPGTCQGWRLVREKMPSECFAPSGAGTYGRLPKPSKVGVLLQWPQLKANMPTVSKSASGPSNWEGSLPKLKSLGAPQSPLSHRA